MRTNKPKRRKPPDRLNPAFAFSYVERALREGLAIRRFTVAESAEADRFFGDPPQCVYCGGPGTERWDHLVAVMQDGETVLGNMVPACAACDDSKGKTPFADWLQNPRTIQALGISLEDANRRISRLQQYMAEFGYCVRTLEDRLDEYEKQELQEIRADALCLRQRIETLIARFRSRTGSR